LRYENLTQTDSKTRTHPEKKTDSASLCTSGEIQEHGIDEVISAREGKREIELNFC